MPLADTIETLTVAQLLERWPLLIPLLNDYRTACVGCSLSCFCTLATILAEYNIPRDELLPQIRQLINDEGEK